MSIDSRQLVERRCMDTQLIDRWGCPPRSIEEGMELRIGKTAGDCIEHTFATA